MFRLSLADLIHVPADPEPITAVGGTPFPRKDRTVQAQGRTKRWLVSLAGLGSVLLALALFHSGANDASADPPWRFWFKHHAVPCVGDDGPPLFEVGGAWYWLRSPDEEKR